MCMALPEFVPLQNAFLFVYHLCFPFGTDITIGVLNIGIKHSIIPHKHCNVRVFFNHHSHLIWI